MFKRAILAVFYYLPAEFSSLATRMKRCVDNKPRPFMPKIIDTAKIEAKAACSPRYRFSEAGGSNSTHSKVVARKGGVNNRLPQAAIALLVARLFIFSGAIVLFAGAKTQAVENGCSLSAEKFGEAKTVQNDFSLDYFSRIKKELRIRKDLLGETLNCLVAETRALEGELRRVRVSTSEARTLHAQFSEWFPFATNYYELQKVKINDLGLEGSKTFARGLAAWREGNYKPTARLITNFILWAQNQDLIQAAKNRLSRGEAVIEALQIAPEYWEAKKMLREAGVEFQAALASNLKAYEAIRAYDPSDVSLEAVKATLDSLALTYKKILAAAELITAPPKEKE